MSTDMNDRYPDVTLWPCENCHTECVVEREYFVRNYLCRYCRELDKVTREIEIRNTKRLQEDDGPPNFEILIEMFCSLCIAASLLGGFAMVVWTVIRFAS